MSKKLDGTKTIINRTLKAKIEELYRVKELDMFLFRRELGLEDRKISGEVKTKSDMSAYVKDLIKKLKKQRQDNK